MTVVLEITSSNDTPWAVTLFETTKYGLTVRFYDASNTTKFPPLGQYVCEHFPDTILGLTGGINLHGGVPAWQIDVATIVKIQDWITAQLSPPCQIISLANRRKP